MTYVAMLAYYSFIQSVSQSVRVPVSQCFSEVQAVMPI